MTSSLVTSDSLNLETFMSDFFFSFNFFFQRLFIFGTERDRA